MIKRTSYKWILSVLSSLILILGTLCFPTDAYAAFSSTNEILGNYDCTVKAWATNSSTTGSYSVAYLQNNSSVIAGYFEIIAWGFGGEFVYSTGTDVDIIGPVTSSQTSVGVASQVCLTKLTLFGHTIQAMAHN